MTRRLLALVVGAASLLVGVSFEHQAPALVQSAAAKSCPAEMALVGGFCIDRWEVHTVDMKSGKVLSPFYPPEPRTLQFAHDFWVTEKNYVGTERARALPLPPLPAHQKGEFSPRAVSSAGVLPQGYMSYFSAKRACAPVLPVSPS